jgi:hypothetical protein
MSLFGYFNTLMNDSKCAVDLISILRMTLQKYVGHFLLVFVFECHLTYYDCFSFVISHSCSTYVDIRFQQIIFEINITVFS